MYFTSFSFSKARYESQLMHPISSNHAVQLTILLKNGFFFAIKTIMIAADLYLLHSYIVVLTLKFKKFLHIS